MIASFQKQNQFVRLDSIRSLVKIAPFLSMIPKLSFLAELSFLLQYNNSRGSFCSISRSQIILREGKNTQKLLSIK